LAPLILFGFAPSEKIRSARVYSKATESSGFSIGTLLAIEPFRLRLLKSMSTGSMVNDVFP